MKKNIFFHIMRRKTLLIYFSLVIFTIILLVSNFPINSYDEEIETNYRGDLESSATLEDQNKLVITKINREVNLTRYGLVDISDELEIKNVNDNPVDSFLFGIPKLHAEDLVYLEVLGDQKSSLYYQRKYKIVDQFELIEVYLDDPILPLETINVSIIQTYKDRLEYGIVGFQQQVNYTGYIYPILPYTAQGDNLISTFRIPDSATFIDQPDAVDNTISYNFTTYFTNRKQIDPLLSNLGAKMNVSLAFSENTYTKIEMVELTREIYISSWGIIKISEEYVLQNKGEIDVSRITLIVPGAAKSIRVHDKLGELSGVVIDPAYNYTFEEKEVNIDFSINRIRIGKNSKFRFTLEYNLPIENYMSFNWILESIHLNIFTTKYDFLGRDQTIKIILDGVYRINFISHPPDAIEYEIDKKILIYHEEIVSPKEKKFIQFTFTIDIFNLLLRPLAIILCLIGISSIFVVVVKTRKKEVGLLIPKEIIPSTEIREFCLLYEEKSALLIENRNLLEDLRYKKVSKPKFKNIITRNEKRIEEINKDLEPLQEILIETNETFANIIKRLEVLDAERQSIKDSLNLLEIRYKKGKLPSKTAYEKLTRDFIKRRNKVDRTIDRLIQQLRSYLLK